MDYEKAYKAAKRLAAHWIENGCEATEKILLETIFPELKESENERIRKEIITYLYNELHNIKQLTPRTNQTESWIAYLEKWKETLKLTNSIPANCASSAKLEDSWHKVADSVPDSAREVICKDAIGNFFIGRYYKGSKSWEVSMYDDVDKSNDDNPPVVMWCDIPSEKHIEQKPVGDGTRAKIISRATSEKQVVLVSESDGNAEIGWDARSLEDAKNLLEYGISFINEQLGVKPAEWSEEDAEHIKSLLARLEGMCKKGATFTQTRFAVSEDMDWLKSLRHSWKPSDEQLRPLEYAINYFKKKKNDTAYLESLLFDLQKLL